MANTYSLISSATVGSGGAASIDFSSIPSTYTDLCVKVSTRCTQGGNGAWLHIGFNSSTANFTTNGLYSSGTGTGISYGAGTYIAFNNAAGDTANTFSNSEFYIVNYTSSNYKNVSSDSVEENNSSTGFQVIGTALWSVTSAITAISLYPDSGNFVQYSTAYLYGIKNS